VNNGEPGQNQGFGLKARGEEGSDPFSGETMLVEARSPLSASYNQSH